MHLGDSIFIFLLALVLFGPKRLPEIGRQVGKILAEFRRASNEFKFQIQEELRTMEEDERRKKLAEAQALKEASASAMASATPAPESAIVPASSLLAPAESGMLEPKIMPPATGAPVSADRPYATASAAEVPEPNPETEHLGTGTAAPLTDTSSLPPSALHPVPHTPDAWTEPAPAVGSEPEQKIEVTAPDHGADSPASESPEAAPTAHHA